MNTPSRRTRINYLLAHKQQVGSLLESLRPVLLDLARTTSDSVVQAACHYCLQDLELEQLQLEEQVACTCAGPVTDCRQLHKSHATLLLSKLNLSVGADEAVIDLPCRTLHFSQDNFLIGYTTHDGKFVSAKS